MIQGFGRLASRDLFFGAGGGRARSHTDDVTYTQTCADNPAVFLSWHHSAGIPRCREDGRFVNSRKSGAGRPNNSGGRFYTDLSFIRLSLTSYI